MIPVSLTLENFLSYRKPEEPLNFEGFQVACLSGGNGQGKSALLDAITWVLWGEGRKSQGTVKPDEQLMRSGASEMSVTLVFDLEGARFRVKRYFGKSGSRKTQKSNLEFQIFDAEKGAFVTQTGARIKDTQLALNQQLGLSYETFINASFLLQGRSDQFTKQAPTERKRILADILNLQRYDKLKERASEKVKNARNALEVAEMRLQQLEAQTKDLPNWQAARDQAVLALTDQEKILHSLNIKEQQCLSLLAALDLKTQEIQTEERLIGQLNQQATLVEDRRQTLVQLTAEAEELLSEEPRILSAYEKYKILTKEQEELQLKSELARSLEEQQRSVENEIQKLIAGAEQQLAQFKQTLQHINTQLAEENARILREPEALSAFKEAQAASAKWEEMRVIRDQVNALTQEHMRISQELTLKERSLTAEKERIAHEITNLTLLAEQTAIAKQQLEEAKTAHLLLQNKTAALNEMRTQGQVQKAEMNAEKAKCQTIEAEIQQIQQNRLLVEQAQSETCPTCGTLLTEAHRVYMLALYDEQLSEITKRFAIQEAIFTKKRLAVHKIGQQFKDLEAECKELSGVQGKLDEANNFFLRAEQASERLTSLRITFAELGREMTERTQLKPLEIEKRKFEQAIEALAFDEATFTQLGQTAAKKELLERELRVIEAARGKAEALQIKYVHTEQQLQKVRADLSSRSITTILDDKKRGIQQKLLEVAYNRDKHQEVRLALSKMKDIPQQYANLTNAALNVRHYETELLTLKKRATEIAEQQQDATQKLDQLRSELAIRPSLETERLGLKAQLTEAQRILDTHREQLGRLASMIEMGEKDLDEMKRLKNENRDKIRDRDLYTHLVKAFGSEGIPAIIIEETLPELQERANDLLSRLSDGRMSIRLETIKNMKSGGSKSTLDIIINDELAQARPYETFSGGEAFRIDFALRIALSQLLADRAGVRIRTLVIDEGFGTQDQQGIQYMISAIEAIRHDFEKIIIITHLDELKSAFPVRIEVRKEPDGSRYEVYHEG